MDWWEAMKLFVLIVTLSFSIPVVCFFTVMLCTYAAALGRWKFRRDYRRKLKWPTNGNDGKSAS